MDVGLFDFDLPDDRIALRPAEPRDAARLLVVPSDTRSFEDRMMMDLPGLLRDGDVLVVNDTRVVAAELAGVRLRGDTAAGVNVNLLQRVDDAHWRVLLRPAKRVRAGERLVFGIAGEATVSDGVGATVVEKDDGGVFLLKFDLAGDTLTDRIDAIGQMPLPPYIGTRRDQDGQDASDYQTIFADRAGAVAAPTAGLHFTERLLDAIAARGVARETVTLHVGGGTFLPVRVDDTEAHVMHAEWGEVREDIALRLAQARADGRRVVCVGTTSLRVLESAAVATGAIAPFLGETDIFITPGYQFRAVDALLTNFHLPRSTLFMLVSAFSGLERMQTAYAHAVANDYRFYSYGDACFLERA